MLLRLLVPAALLSLALFMQLLACALYNNWTPMALIVPYAALPLPLLMIKRGQGDDALFDAPSAPYLHFGAFLASTLLTLIVGIPLVLVHLDVIEMGAAYFCFSALCLLAATAAASALLSGGDSDESGWG